MPSSTDKMTGRLTPPGGASSLLDLPELQQALGEKSARDPGALLATMKSTLNAADEQLAQRFWDDEPVENLVKSRAWVIEQLLITAWREMMPPLDNVALILPVTVPPAQQLFRQVRVDLSTGKHG